MTTKEQLLERVPSLTEAQATAALRVVDAQEQLAAFFEDEAKLSDEQSRSQSSLPSASARSARR